jgi:S1-C subfamily serine protease
VLRNDELIQDDRRAQPGRWPRCRCCGRALAERAVKLAERPLRERQVRATSTAVQQSRPALGLSCAKSIREFAQRFNLPKGLEGVIVSRVDPMSPAFDADIERGHVLLEINRQPCAPSRTYRRLTAQRGPAKCSRCISIKPEITRRELHTVKVDKPPHPRH